MNNRKILEKISNEIHETAEALLRYQGYADKRSSDYGDGWTDAIDQFALDLLGRQSEDPVKILAERAGLDPEKSQVAADKLYKKIEKIRLELDSMMEAELDNQTHAEDDSWEEKQSLVRINLLEKVLDRIEDLKDDLNLKPELKYGGTPRGEPVGTIFYKRKDDDFWEVTFERIPPKAVKSKHGRNARSLQPVYTEADHEAIRRGGE